VQTFRKRKKKKKSGPLKARRKQLTMGGREYMNRLKKYLKR
jgi:hypothetical protein